MRILAWISVLLTGLASWAAASNEDFETSRPLDRSLSIYPGAEAGYFDHRKLDPALSQCCGMCTMVRLTSQVVVLLIDGDGINGPEIGGQLHPFLTWTQGLVIDIIVRITLTYTEGSDPTQKTTVFDVIVRPEDWNEPCSYQGGPGSCIVFQNDEVRLIAPSVRGANDAVLSLDSVTAFTSAGDITVVQGVCDVRCADSGICNIFEDVSAGILAADLDPSGQGIGFAETITTSTLFGGFCTTACPAGVAICSDPHLQGLQGQHIDVNGVDGGWYCLVKDDEIDLHVNVRFTAPLTADFPHRQLITGLAVLSGGHSFVIEAKNPYDVATTGCPSGVSPCLADGGLRVVVDGREADELLRSTRGETLVDHFELSASNLPVECRQFGGDKLWARMFEEMVQGKRQLRSESFEDWVLTSGRAAAPDWCEKYITERGLSHVQSNHALVRITTPSIVVRLSAGVNQQGDGDQDFDGTVLPDLEFWQMDVGFEGLDVEHPRLTGILGETARPVVDDLGRPYMEGEAALRGTVEDYRVSDALGVDFALLHA